MRLARAHEALTAADPTAGDTVTTIAQDWGFMHAGRFSQLYRENYGTSPLVTLRTG